MLSPKLSHRAAPGFLPLADEVGLKWPAVRLPAPRVVGVLVVAYAVLLVLHLVVVSSYLLEWRFPARDRFYFDHENNLPTFFSTLLLLGAAGLLGWIAAVKRQARDRFFWHWLGMCGVFIALAADEAASLHEVLINPLRTGLQLTGFLWFGWVIVGAAFVALFALAYLRFLAHLPARFRGLFLLAGGLYVTGALLLEMVGGQVFLAGQPEGQLLPYMVVMTLEESLEMAGIIVLIHTLLRYLRTYSPRMTLEVAGRTAPASAAPRPVRPVS